MTRHTLLLLVATLSSVGCGAPKVYVKAIKAASVSIPQEVQRVAIVDRSRPKNVGQTVVGVLEGAVTGEVPFEDHEGRDQAIRTLVTVLEQSPRYEVTRPLLTPDDVDSNSLDKPWNQRAVARLCQEHGCDAVIALEVFDTNATVDMGLIERAPEPEPEAATPAPTGKPSIAPGGGDSPAVDKTPAEGGAEEPPPPPPKTHWAERKTRLRATWRMYDADEDRILDEVRDRAIGSSSRVEAYSTEEAVRQLASASAMIGTDGRKLGQEYGRRIAPTWVGIERKYYGGGGAMKLAQNHVEAGDWEGASALWREVVDNPQTSAKKRGKARYNLAIAAEMETKLKKAHKLAQKAAIELHNNRSQQYVRSLERRVIEQAKVEEQLAPPEEGE